MNEINLIDNLYNGGKITVKFADLLRSIGVSTRGPEEASLRKVQAVIALRGMLKDRAIAQKHAAYIGSGFDWRFPVALGARDIVMIDPTYQNPAHRQELLRNIRQHGAEIITAGIDNTMIMFALDLGEGNENVTLRLDKTDVYEYEPQQPLGFILQFRGPTAFGVVPVPENIIRGMTSDGLVFNFDYPRSRYTPNIGMELIEREGFCLYQVRDIDKMITATAVVIAPPEPFLKISRAIRDSRQKKL